MTDSNIPVITIKIFYFKGIMPVTVRRQNYYPDVYDGRTFYGFKKR